MPLRREMNSARPQIIRIAAALIDDGDGNIYLVRKTGTGAFMQAGGKIERGETPIAALLRELREELGFSSPRYQPTFLGCFSANAANEPGHVVSADIFHVRTAGPFTLGAEIEEGLWVGISDARALCLAPLTRDWVLPMASRLADPAEPPSERSPPHGPAELQPRPRYPGTS